MRVNFKLKRKKRSRALEQNEGAQLSNELEGDGALVEDLESLGPMASVGPYATETECAHEDVAKFDNPAVKIMFQVTQIVKNHCTFPA